VQNEPNFEKPKNQPNLFSHKQLWQNARLETTQKRTQTNPNEPKANPIFRPSAAPKAKTNPNKPKQTQFILP
jgi:hypothetical protein